MTRFVSCPAREKGETGRAFVERMLAALNTGGATALPAPPKIVITAEVKPNVRVRVPRSVPAVANPRPNARPEARRPEVAKPTEIKRPITIPEVYGPPPKPRELSEPFGPVYPALPGANKWRKLARMRELTRDENREYGQTVLDAINAMNAKLLDREVAPFRSNSASGTFHNNGKDILRAINEQNRRAATSY
jgi:hypothetical protein